MLQLPSGMHDAACRAQSLGNRIWIVVFGSWQSYPIASQIVQPEGACLALATMRALSGIKSYIWISFASSFSLILPSMFFTFLAIFFCRRDGCQTINIDGAAFVPRPALCVLRVIPFPPASNRKSNTQRQKGAAAPCQRFCMAHTKSGAYPGAGQTQAILILI